MPTTVGLAELRARLGDLLRGMRTGEEMVIAERGRSSRQIVAYGRRVEQRPELEGLLAWRGKELAGHAPVTRARGERTLAELLVEEQAERDVLLSGRERAAEAVCGREGEYGRHEGRE